MEKLKGALAVGFLRLFALLPWGAVQATGSAIGWMMWKLPNGSREVVRINLAKCFPELSAAERERLVGQTLRDIGKTLKKLGFTFVGPTICYAYMQAAGMVMDHTTDCDRYHALRG